MNAVQMAPLTVEDYRLLPETGPRYQLIEGDLYMAPAPSRYHQDIVGNLHAMIHVYLEKHRTGKVYMAPFDVFLDEINAHQPDLVYVSNRNKILTPKGAVGAPEFVVEVLSPTTSHLDKKPKRRVYARTGVKEYWIIDPDPRVIHVYFLQENAEHPKVTYSLGDTFSSIHFPGLKFRTNRIFRE